MQQLFPLLEDPSSVTADLYVLQVQLVIETRESGFRDPDSGVPSFSRALLTLVTLNPEPSGIPGFLNMGMSAN